MLLQHEDGVTGLLPSPHASVVVSHFIAADVRLDTHIVHIFK